MTAPASILASFAQPASRLAMGDATGAALGGFEALLAMLTQSLQNVGQDAGQNAGQGADEAAAATGEPALETTTEAPAGAGALAALLAQAGPAAWLTQTLSQVPASSAPAVPASVVPAPVVPAPVVPAPVVPASVVPASVVPPAVVEDAAAPAPVTCAVPQAKSLLASEPTPVQAGAVQIDASQIDAGQVVAAPIETAQTDTAQAGPVPAESVQAASVQAASVQPDAIDTTALDALLRRHAPEAVDPAILERIRPVKGQTAAQSLQSLAPAAVEQAVEVAVVAQVQTDAAVRLTAEASPEAAAETVAAPIVIAPPTEAKAPVPPRKAAPIVDGKVVAVEKAETGDSVAPVDTAEAADQTAADDTAPVEGAAREAETPAAPARSTETAVQALAARLETVAAGATALAAQARGAPETVTKLAAGIVSKLEGQSTRFDLQLDPHGLGKVDVSVEIASDGKLTAQLGFDSALGLSELRGRVQELRTALEQAGFSLADNALSFDFSGERRQQQAADRQAANTDQAGKAFAKALGALDEALAATPIRYQARRGLDLLI